MAPVMTAKDAILWTQRIEKELRVNGQSRADFSVRNCVSSADVPKKFKPGHVDPVKDAVKNGVFDPCDLGWQPDATITKEFRRCINRQRGVPRGRHQFPESRCQEHGWVQTEPGMPEERSCPAGSNPSKLGIGWLQKDGHGGPTTKKAAIDAEKPEFQAYIRRLLDEETRPKPRKSKDGNRREELGVPPYASQTGKTVREQTRSRSQMQSGRPHKSEAHSGSQRLSRSCSLPGLAAGTAPGAIVDGVAAANARLNVQEEGVQKAMDNARLYLNRHQKNPWYHPLSQCDVSTFSNAYTLAWGRNLFHKVEGGR